MNILIRRYCDAENVETAALNCLIDNNIQSLPIMLVPIAQNYGIRVKANTSAKILKPKERGKIIGFSPPIIVLDDTLSEQVQRYTLAHEIGHWVLGHLSKNIKHLPRQHLTNPQEIEAESFAALFIAPTCVIWGLNLHTPQEIAEACNISLQDATIRAEQMEVLYKRNTFLSHPLERQVYEKFKPWIDKTKKYMKEVNEIE